MVVQQVVGNTLEALLDFNVTSKAVFVSAHPHAQPAINILFREGVSVLQWMVTHTLIDMVDAPQTI